MSDHPNARLVREYIDRLNRRDLSVLDELVSDDFRAVVRAAYESRISTYPDYHVTIDDMIAEDDQVVVEWIHTGTHRGTYYGVPPSNRRIVGHCISIYRLRDGRIVGARGLWDRGEIWQQLDLIPPTDQILPDAAGCARPP